MTPTMMETLEAMERLYRLQANAAARDAGMLASGARRLRANLDVAVEAQDDARLAYEHSRWAYQLWSDIDALLRHERAARTPRPIVGRLTIEEVVADYLGLAVDELPHVRIISDVHKVGGRWPWERES